MKIIKLAIENQMKVIQTTNSTKCILKKNALVILVWRDKLALS